MPNGVPLTRPLSLTAEQRKALDPCATVWVDAAAGSGKTQVLVARMLRLLLEGARPESLLCLTFTKAAAAEMTQRLMDRLAHWATTDATRLAADMEALGVSADDAHVGLARALFAMVLELEGGLRISTLHGFCQSLLARFPLEAEIEPGFGLLEGNDQRALLGDVLLAVARDAVGGSAPRLLDAFASLDEARGRGTLHAVAQSAIRACAGSVALDGLAREGLLTLAELSFALPDARDFPAWLRQTCPPGLVTHLRTYASALEAHGTETDRGKVSGIRAAADAAAVRRRRHAPSAAGCCRARCRGESSAARAAARARRSARARSRAARARVAARRARPASASS